VDLAGLFEEEQLPAQPDLRESDAQEEQRALDWLAAGELEAYHTEVNFKDLPKPAPH
jgi:hypothetical protein